MNKPIDMMGGRGEVHPLNDDDYALVNQVIP